MNLWPHDLRKLAAPARRMVLVSVLAFGTILLGVYVWRISTFDRTIATVVSVRDEARRSGSVRRYVTVGELTFTRVDKEGRSFDCRHEFDIGVPEDRFAPGDKLEIIPATGSCQRADIIGRPEGDRP